MTDPMVEDAMVEIQDLTKRFDTAGESRLVLDSVSFGADAGEFVSVIGPSGCGKSTIFNVLAVAENYPDLKASANFLHLQEQLADTENQLAFSRQYYNDAVATLNKKVVTIPWLLFTGIAVVSKREFYRAPAGQDVPPQVQF